MKEVFLPAREAGVSVGDIVQWLNRPHADPKSWTLKQGAPAKIVDLFPQYVEFMIETGQGEKPSSPPSDVNFADPSLLFVRIWQLARDARSHVDMGIALNVNREYVEKIEAHAKHLEALRDQIHDAMLTDEDKANGAVPRSER